MNTLKMFLSAIMFLAMSILTGCSNNGDPVSSSGVSENKNVNFNSVTANESLPIIEPVTPPYKEQIRLKPFRSYTFTVSSTQFAKINSVDVNSVSSGPSPGIETFKCSDLIIYGDTKNEVEISCHSKNLDVSWLTIENLSSKMFDLNVSLQGVKVKKIK